MTEEKRKYLRIALPAKTAQDFASAKKDAEDRAMMKMTDTQFATRLIQWAIEKEAKQA